MRFDEPAVKSLARSAAGAALEPSWPGSASSEWGSTPAPAGQDL
jgi:hypothetical protein